MVLDAFGYADAAAAREAWKANEGTPPVDVSRGKDAPALLLTAPFAGDQRLPRTVIDRRVQLDLRGAGGFALDVEIVPAEAVKYLSLYFHSRGGWYGAGGAAAKKGWQTVRFPKAEFRIEEKPGGWGAVDGIRIAGWRGEAVDAVIRLRRLVALESDVALISRDGAIGHEAGPLCDMLAELGLDVDVVSDADVHDGGLGRRRIAVLSNRGDIGDKAVAALVRYVESGGKLFVCYAMPPRLGPVLGFNNPEWVRESRPGEFAEICFKYTGIVLPGHPRSVRQNSWNITTMQPAGHNALIVADWFDDAGKLTGRPALLISDRGAFFSHIVLGDDRENMRRMLATIFARLEPLLWETIARAAINRAGRVGHCRSEQELVEYLKAAGDATPDYPLFSARMALSQARPDCEPLSALAVAETGHDTFIAFYLRSQPSPRVEGRAMWDHAGTGPYPGDWDRAAKILHENGFNMIVPNMLWAGEARYASDLLPRGETFRRYGDQIEQCGEGGEKIRPRSPRLESQFQPRHGIEGIHRSHAARRPHASDFRRQANRLALPLKSGEPAVGAGEHVGSGPKTPGRRAALRLHSLSRQSVVLLRRLPAAVRGGLRPCGGKIGPPTALHITVCGKTNTMIGDVAR